MSLETFKRNDSVSCPLIEINLKPNCSVLLFEVIDSLLLQRRHIWDGEVGWQRA